MLLAEIRHAFRRLRASPGFTMAALLTLALGIGVTSTMFTLLNAMVLQPARVARGSGQVAIFRTSKQSQELGLTPGIVDDLRRQSSTIANIDTFLWNAANLVEPGQPPLRMSGLGISGGYFRQIGAQALLGRAILPSDDQPGAPKVAVLSEHFWRLKFAADPSVVGRTVHIDANPTTIVGIMPEAAEHRTYFGVVDLWIPESYAADTWANRSTAWLQAIARPKPGVTPAQFEADLAAIASRAAHDHPKTDAGFGLRAEPWADVMVGELSARISWLCMGLAAFVLLIACANLANLQLTRAASRLYEHALCTALGASRTRLLRRFVVENVLLSLGGGILGILLATWATRAIGASIIIQETPGVDLPVDRVVLGFSLAASLLTGLVCALAPAWFSSRTDVNTTLRQGSRGATAGAGRSRLRQIMIVAELAMALLLLTGASFFVGAMHRYSQLDLGWQPKGLVTGSIYLPFTPKYASNEACQTFVRELEGKLRELPGIDHASVSATLPINGFWQQFRVKPEGGIPAESGREPAVFCNPVTSDYFAAVGIGIRRGRAILPSDRETTTAVAVINQAMAASLWPGVDPVGRRFADAGTAQAAWITVVGVANNISPVLDIVRPPATAFQIYRPISQVPGDTIHYLSIAVRGTAVGSAVGDGIRRAVAAVDSEEPVYSLHTATEASEFVVSGFHLMGRLLSAFAVVGLVLSAIGLYGVIAYLVAQRTPEIGIRMALGANVSDVLWLVMGQGFRLSAVGIVIGLGLSFALVRLLGYALPLMPAGGSLWVLAVAGLLFLVALFATWLPARRAARISPCEALRSQ